MKEKFGIIVIYMNFLTKNWKKIVLGLLGSVLLIIIITIIGIFLWMRSWKIYEFPDSKLTFQYPSGGVLTSLKTETGGLGEYKIDYKNFIYLMAIHYNCSRNIKLNLDKETCGEKSAITSIVSYTGDTHPFYTNPENDVKNFKIRNYNAYLLTLHTNSDLASKNTVSNTILAFNDKDEVYFMNLGNYFSDKNIFLNYVSKLIMKLIINSIQFH